MHQSKPLTAKAWEREKPPERAMTTLWRLYGTISNLPVPRLDTVVLYGVAAATQSISRLVEVVGGRTRRR